MLQEFGVRDITAAPDAASALEELNDCPVDLVICEYRLKPIDGLEFAKMVRTAKDSRDPLVPMLVLAAHSELERVISVRDAGISGVIAKPVSPEHLLRHIVELIEWPRQFVRSSDFFGPDRRARAKDSHIDIPRRRASDKLLHRPGARTATKIRRVASLPSNIRVKQSAVA